MPCELETILSNACTSGIGSVQDEVTLLKLTAQLLCNRSGCGDPTLTVSISGAGDADANGNFVSGDGGITFTNLNSYVIFSNGTDWLLVNELAESMYVIPVDEFPCGNWTVALGAAPAPSGVYV